MKKLIRKVKDVWAYTQGNVRYWFYYNMPVLMREHIKEQIALRIVNMDKECYNQGSCIICGCKTTHLQMANKQCDKPCYPRMLNKKTWEAMKDGLPYVDYQTRTKWFLDGDIFGHKTYK